MGQTLRTTVLLQDLNQPSLVKPGTDELEETCRASCLKPVIVQKGYVRKGIAQFETASQRQSSDLDPGLLLPGKVLFPPPLNKYSFKVPRIVQWRALLSGL